MLDFIIVLLLCQLAGEAVVNALALPVPGPVLGMVILFCGLMVRGGVPDGLQRTSAGLLEHLSLLFVPAGVGVMLHLRLLAEEWVPILTGLVVSTLLAIAATALIMAWLSKTLGNPARGSALKRNGPARGGGGERP